MEETNYACKNPTHSEIIRSIFPVVNGREKPIDLYGLFEIKEAYTDRLRYTVGSKDKAAPYFLFYSHKKNEFLVVPTSDVNLDRPKTSILHITAKKKSLFTTHCYRRIRRYVHTVAGLKELSEEYIK